MAVNLFEECRTCHEKPGSPTLCLGCQWNRTVISILISDLNLNEKDQQRIEEKAKRLTNFWVSPHGKIMLDQIREMNKYFEGITGLDLQSGVPPLDRRDSLLSQILSELRGLRRDLNKQEAT